MGWKGALIEPIIWSAGVAFGSSGTPPEVATPRSILVLRPNDLGDLLTATPIFEALRNQFPVSNITAGIGSWGGPVLANNPYVNEVAYLDVPWNNKFVADQSWSAVAKFLVSSRQIKELSKHGGFDVGIDLLGSHLGLLMMLRLGARYRVGIRGYRGGWSGCHRFTHFSKGVHVSQAALNQAALLGTTTLPEARPQLFLTEVERSEAASLWSGPRIESRIRILVGCGGGLPGKCYPADALGNVLSKLVDTLPADFPEMDILITGGPGDVARADSILSHCGGRVRSVCGVTSLRITFAVAEQSDFVITNASMLLHVAAAFRRPTLAILGGLNGDSVEHDRLWGYPPPYDSIGPLPDHQWPDAVSVLQKLTAMLLEAVARRRVPTKREID